MNKMDLLVYCAILLIAGFMRVSKTSSVSDEVNITGTTGIVESCDLPYGNNYQLLKEPGAYTYILRELGLM